MIVSTIPLGDNANCVNRCSTEILSRTSRIPEFVCVSEAVYSYYVLLLQIILACNACKV